MTGDTANIFARLKNALPLRWFGLTSDSVPVIDSVLWGIASLLAFAYSLYAYAKLQTRILTATDTWLDLIAYDYFGGALKRGAGQSDAGFRSAILANMFRAKATRAAISAILTQLTGVVPTIIEVWRPADTGAYGSLTTPAFGIMGYAVAGNYGSTVLSCQIFITTAPGLPGIADADLYAAVDATKAAGIEAWVRIT
jgi:nitrate reductase NapE component